MQDNINPTDYRHTHNGVDSPQIYIPGAALTSKDSATLSTGGTENLRTTDSLVIDNMRTRINELETRLQALSLIQ